MFNDSVLCFFFRDKFCATSVHHSDYLSLSPSEIEHSKRSTSSLGVPTACNFGKRLSHGPCLMHIECFNKTGRECMHGTPLQDEGMSIIVTALDDHPKLQSLDLGDCQLGDDGLANVCSLLSSNGSKAGIMELTLTGNQGISQAGWAQLAMAIANGSPLASLFLDYNNIGDFGAGAFAVALAASKTMKVVDFEGCGITDVGAELLYDLITSYNTPLREINLAENKISEDLLEDIKDALDDDKQKDSLPRRRSSPQGKATSPE